MFHLERIMKDALPYPRELYRLWFEYLRLAHASHKPEVKAALKESSNFYALWGNFHGMRFDIWWKEHRRLFEDKHGVKRLGHGEGYQYSHDAADGRGDQDYLGVEKTYYEPVDRGFEAELKRRLDEWRSRRGNAD